MTISLPYDVKAKMDPDQLKEMMFNVIRDNPDEMREASDMVRETFEIATGRRIASDNRILYLIKNLAEVEKFNESIGLNINLNVDDTMQGLVNKLSPKAKALISLDVDYDFSKEIDQLYNEGIEKAFAFMQKVMDDGADDKPVTIEKCKTAGRYVKAILVDSLSENQKKWLHDYRVALTLQLTKRCMELIDLIDPKDISIAVIDKSVLTPEQYEKMKSLDSIGMNVYATQEKLPMEQRPITREEIVSGITSTRTEEAFFRTFDYFDVDTGTNTAAMEVLRKLVAARSPIYALEPSEHNEEKSKEDIEKNRAMLAKTTLTYYNTSRRNFVSKEALKFAELRTQYLVLFGETTEEKFMNLPKGLTEPIFFRAISIAELITMVESEYIKLRSGHIWGMLKKRNYRMIVIKLENKTLVYSAHRRPDAPARTKLFKGMKISHV